MFAVKFSKEEKTSIYVSIALCIMGYIVSMFTKDDVFPRFGALIVCVGVWFSIKGLPQLLDAAQPIFQSQIAEVRLKFSKANKGNLLKEHAEAELESSIKALEEKLSRTLYSLKNRLLKVEGSIVIIGTIIWAFGDYVVFSVCAS